MTMPPTEFRSASHRDYWQNRERRRAYYAAYHKRRMAEDSVYAEKRRASARRGAKKRRDESLAIIREAKRRPCPSCGGDSFNRWQTREVVSKGLIDWDDTLAGLAVRGVELRGGAADEAPGAYKRLADVLAAHEGTVRILHRLRPVGVAMAGPDTVDPYKD